MASFRSGARKPYSRPSGADGQWLHDKAPTGPRADANGSGHPKVAFAAGNVVSGNSKLLVSNLHYEITPKDLTSIFGQIGTLVREPLIRYDRSGRSTGVAIISFETPTEATRAKKQFDGILAKGQPMSITYDTMPPRNPRRAASAPSLINRIQKPPLLDRLSRDDAQIKTPSAPRGLGPIRSRPSRGLPAPRLGPKKPKTAEELDKELDAFMGDSDTAAPTTEVEVPMETPAQDVEMA